LYGLDPKAAFSVVRAVRNQTGKFLAVKLSPNVTDITEIARAVEDAGADCLTLINTLTAMAIDIETRRPRLANITGGLSGPAIKPVALRMVWQVARVAKVPIIGIGGIMSAADALEFIIAGASAIQVGTANFVNPHATVDIVDGIEKFLVDHNIDKISDLIGTLET
jgi:dihydroorotate dehydrogenase (NAD+) catalytic subunit